MADAEEGEPGGAPATLADVRSLLAQRDELLAGLLQDCDGQTAHFRRTSGSAGRRELERELVAKYSGGAAEAEASEGGRQGDIVSEYKRMVAAFLLLSTAGWTIALLDAASVLDGARAEAMSRALYAATMPMSITFCPMLYYGTLGTGEILSDARLNVVCWIAFVVDGLCYGEDFFSLQPYYGYVLDAGSAGGDDFGAAPTIVLSILFWVMCTVVFGWLGVNVLGLGRRRLIERRLSLARFSEQFCTVSVKIACFQSLLAVMQVVNVAAAETEEQLARARRINEASFSFSLMLAAIYVTKVLAFDVSGLTAHSFFHGEGSTSAVVAVAFGVVGALTATGGWLLAYQTPGASDSTSFAVTSALGNVSATALTLANAANAVNLLPGQGACARFVRYGNAEASEEGGGARENEMASVSTDSPIV